MKFLIDNSKPETMDALFAGQLLTPLTRYSNWSPGCFGVDNGCYSGFKPNEFRALLMREEKNKRGCLFVTVPDVVGNARRTLELWKYRHRFVPPTWPLALVAQNGIEDMDIPWSEFACVFYGGDDSFKCSQAVMDVARTAKILGKHNHLGRCNSDRRFSNWHGIADTCDGSGVSRGLGKHLARIRGGLNERFLFNGVTGAD